MPDEAQDTNPVAEQIFLHQREHAQLVMVGDFAQAIHHWRGAKDVITGFDSTQPTLSQSFRLGPDLATEANPWLPLGPTPPSASPAPPTHRTRPHPAGRRALPHQRRRHGPSHDPHGGRLPGRPSLGRRQPAGPGPHDPRPEGRPPHPPPQAHPLPLMRRSAGLRHPRPGRPRPASPWPTSSTPHGTGTVVRLVPEPHAQVTVCTAHKTKGRKWPRLLIADNSARPENSTPDEQTSTTAPPDPTDDAEARLAYVTVTRTRQRLDPGRLSWTDTHSQHLGPSGTTPSSTVQKEHEQTEPRPLPAHRTHGRQGITGGGTAQESHHSSRGAPACPGPPPSVCPFSLRRR
ncbi:UvrD-helicase domain-containing protein [Streptomyces sudanensis]|nr:UvrD-helicase domain-containing protein [Streptomyces sudanensis]MCP9989207.1 UvrD-helicase domain-containing protein [Streptomyces sudanensis]